MKIIDVRFVYFASFDTDDDYALMKQIKMEPEAMLSQEDDIMAQLQQDSSDLEVEPSFALEGNTNGEDSSEDIILETMQHMDIQEPLSTLRCLLEQRLGLDLTEYTFWLQDTQMVNHIHIMCSCEYIIYTLCVTITKHYTKITYTQLSVAGKP